MQKSEFFDQTEGKELNFSSRRFFSEASLSDKNIEKYVTPSFAQRKTLVITKTEIWYLWRMLYRLECLNSRGLSWKPLKMRLKIFTPFSEKIREARNLQKTLKAFFSTMWIVLEYLSILPERAPFRDVKSHFLCCERWFPVLWRVFDIFIKTWRFGRNALYFYHMTFTHRNFISFGWI